MAWKEQRLPEFAHRIPQRMQKWNDINGPSPTWIHNIVHMDILILWIE